MNIVAESRWWTPQTIPSGHTATLRLGTLELRLNRSNHEWLLALEKTHEDEVAGTIHIANQSPLGANALRYTYHDSSNLALFRPALADRPVVIKPRQPVFVLPGQEAVFYISTPTWVAVCVGASQTVLREFPSERLSETWFGPNTIVGELSYAIATHARSHLSELPLRPYRVVTPVRIENRAETPLPMKKLSLPVPLLSIYGLANGSLWTESVHMLRTTDSDMAMLNVESGPPSYAQGAALLSKPRQADRTGLVRVFSDLFK
ncbi:MAG: hypothetical protein LBV36_02060 [Chromatiales bacterium]|jgi:hypothetical protein|nr:hypothetical protein [Chromatiales bacterium]